MKTTPTHFWKIVLTISLMLGVAAFSIYQSPVTSANRSSDLIRVELPVEPPSLDLTQLEEIAALKRANSGKLDPRLVGLIEWLNGNSDRLPPPELAGLVIEGTNVLVEIRANPAMPQLTTQFLTRERATIRHHNAPGLYEAFVEITNLENLAAHEEIYFIQPARLVKTLAGNSLSQGVTRSFANQWHTSGVTGTGVTIAIIDAFDDTGGEIAALQTSGDWPSGVQLTTVKVGGGTFGDNGVSHGNAVLEITYDMAPGATFIAYDTLTVGDWYNAIGLAVTAGADIISASLGAPLDGIGDGSAFSGSIAEAATNARNAGVLYINAAGNYREEHWGGLYNNHPSINNTHNWGGGGNLNLGGYCLPNGYPVSVELFWDDWTSVNHDYDLRLYRYQNSGWVVAASSLNWQNGTPGQTPQEWIYHTLPGGTRTNPYGCPTNTHVVAVYISRWSAATDRHLQVFTNFGALGIPIYTSSLGFPADSPSVLAAVAVDHNTLAQELYSSEGPILATGGGLPTGSEGPKPDIASYAGGIDTESYGAGVFSGTSAAAPHVAGWAALILQNNPSFDADDLEAEMFALASSSQGSYNNDLGAGGHDFQFGHGLSRFLFTPTAVTLHSLSAHTSTAWLPVFAAVTLLLGLVGVGKRPRRTNQEK